MQGAIINKFYVIYKAMQDRFEQLVVRESKEEFQDYWSRITCSKFLKLKGHIKVIAVNWR